MIAKFEVHWKKADIQGAPPKLTMSLDFYGSDDLRKKHLEKFKEANKQAGDSFVAMNYFAENGWILRDYFRDHMGEVFFLQKQ